MPQRLKGKAAAPETFPRRQNIYKMLKYINFNWIRSQFFYPVVSIGYFLARCKLFLGYGV
jgi:hypothetical protein